MKVSLIAHTSDPVKVLWTAARVCRTEESPQELFFSAMSEEDMVDVLRRVWQAGHLSVFEHVNLTYAIDDVSRVCLAEFTRHRTGIAFSVKGQRMPLETVDYATPPSCSSFGLQNMYRAAVRGAVNNYRMLLKAGVPAEDARYVLPQAAVCNLVCTVNLRELNHLWKERGSNPYAHWEVRSIVRNMIREAVKAFLWLEKINGEWSILTKED